MSAWLLESSNHRLSSVVSHATSIDCSQLEFGHSARLFDDRAALADVLHCVREKIADFLDAD